MANQYNITKTFYDWCIENEHQEYLNLWDYNLNDKTPEQVSFATNNKFWFKCKELKHESYQKTLNNLVYERTKLSCPRCNSIGQYIINNYGEDFLNKIWSDKNKITSFEISQSSKKIIWLKCQENVTHPDYDLMTTNFKKSFNCPYCTGKRTCLTNSLGYKYPQVLDVWSELNEETPYEYTHGSSKKVWWKCEKSIHKDYQREINNSVIYDFRCHECVKKSHYRIDNLINKQFNYLTVTELDVKRTKMGKGTYWFCDCKCGTKHKSVLASHLKSGKTQSCGCLWLDDDKKSTHIYDNTPTSKQRKERRSAKYIKWRNEVIVKDDYTCQCCGKYGGKLNVHHIQNFSENEKLRYDINNAITLCVECHGVPISGSFHNIYGTTNNTSKQLEEYINNKRKDLGINIPFSIEEYLKGNFLKPSDIQKIS